MKGNQNRHLVLCAIALLVVLVYIGRLAYLQLGPHDYKDDANNNAFFNNVKYPSRGLIYDRNGKLLVYNQAAYDVMVVMREISELDTIDFCNTLGISRRQFDNRMAQIKDTRKNPGYSAFSQQLFRSQIPQSTYSVLQEKLFHFKGFYVRKRTVRQYTYGIGGHILGDVAEVSPTDIERDDYYSAGDYIGKQGVERSYEKELRGEKGVEVLLRDARGRLLGHYQNGELDVTPKPGKDLTLTIDHELQAYGERIMSGKRGSIVAIEPSTGEILCAVSAPSYDPRGMTRNGRGMRIMRMSRDPSRPLLNRSISGAYPPGSTFKPAQALMFLQDRIINQNTSYPCNEGFHFRGLKVGCHSHPSPANVTTALAVSCNSFFCFGLYYMFNSSSRYGTVHDAMNRWRDFMVSMGFGYKLGVDLPGEVRGMIPNAEYYDKHYAKWNPLTVASISIGQGEVTATPLQIANLGATIANRGYYVTPHIVKRVHGGHVADSLLQRHNTMVDSRYYETIISGMRQAVINGTCKEARTSPYEICGKTGTAQNRGIDHSVFVGFAPRRNPKIAISVYVENGGNGATMAVPLAHMMFDKYMSILNSHKNDD